MMRKHEIEWELTCSRKEAIEALQKSVASPKKLKVGWWKIEGHVFENGFKIWTTTPGMRGISIVTGNGKILEKNNSSHLSVTDF